MDQTRSGAVSDTLLIIFLYLFFLLFAPGCVTQPKVFKQCSTCGPSDPVDTLCLDELEVRPCGPQIYKQDFTGEWR